jgi:hypothetical protein
MLRQNLFTKPRPYDTKFRRNFAEFRGILRNFAKVFSYFAKFREISRYEISSTTLQVLRCASYNKFASHAMPGIYLGPAAIAKKIIR